MGLDLKRREMLGDLLGREVYVEAFGYRRLGRVASVYRDERGLPVCEVEFSDGIMEQRPFPRLKFVEEGEGS